jgi:hypothetical protein
MIKNIIKNYSKNNGGRDCPGSGIRGIVCGTQVNARKLI